MSAVKTRLYSVLLLFSLLIPAWAQNTPASATPKPFVLYAQFLEETKVELSDGAVWLMDKGDCFPIYMFKENQTKVVLKLASATFMVSADRVRVMKEAENEMGLASYRRNLTDYLNGRADVWKKDAVKKKKGEGAEKAKQAALPATASDSTKE